MTVPTQPVTIKLADFGGPSAAGITVTARMSDVDYTAAGVFVDNSPVIGVTDASGQVVLNVFPNGVSPNGLGTRGTTIRFTAMIPGSRPLDVQAAIPNAPCNLVDVLVEVDPVGLTAAQLAVSQAQAAAVDAINTAQLSEDWATKTSATVDGAEFSSKEYAQGSQAGTGGSAKNWSTKTSSPVDGVEFSAKEYAKGSQPGTGGSSKNWATQTGSDVTGAAVNSRSSRSWAQENLEGATLGGSAKDWAQGTLPDAVNKSAKAYATDAATAASAATAQAGVATTQAGLVGTKTNAIVYGTSGDPVSGTGAASNTLVYPIPLVKAAPLTGVKFRASGAGNLKIKRFNSSFVEQASITLTCVGGLNTFTTAQLGSFQLQAGDFIGYYSTVGYRNAGTDLRGAYYDGGAGDLTNPAHSSIITSFVPQIQFTFTPLVTTASEEQANHASTSRFKEEAKIVHRIGHQSDTIPDGTATSNGHFLFLDPTARAGRIAKFRAYMSSVQYITLWAWDRSGDTLTKRANPLDLFLMPAGFSEISLDIPLEQGVFVSMEQAGVRFTNLLKFPGRGYQTPAGSTTSLDGSVGSNTTLILHSAIELEYNSYIAQVQKHRVSLGRTDSIALLGNSYGAGAYQPYKKTWLAMLSHMLPWNVHNFSASSQTLAQRLADVRQGGVGFYSNAGDGSAYGDGNGKGATYRDYRNTYALIVLATNTASSTALMNDLHDVLETCRATGAIPILATEIANTLHHVAIYRQMAEKYGGIFIDLAQYTTIFPSVYAGFQSGGHYNYRVAGTLYGTHLARALEALLGAPRTGIKIYRPRPAVAYAVAADLMFDQVDDLRHSLSAKWQEIEIGGGVVLVGDANVGYMDSVNTGGSFTTTAQKLSEYLQAMLGHPLSFTDFALLSFHLDAQPQQCREVRIFVGTGHTAVYARSVYTTGAYPAAGAQQGFWSALPVTTDGWAVVREWEMSGKLSSAGRIDILVEHAGAFTLQSPRAEWWGEGTRTRLGPVSLGRARGTELIATPRPYNAGALASGWSSTGAPTYANTANGGDLPTTCTGYARLTSADTISYAISGITADPFYGREVEICVWASAERALVVGATYPTGASMTGDSWDCEQMTVEHVNGANSAKSTVTLMPYWQEVRIKTWLAAAATTVTVKLGCSTTGAVLVARGSCKLVEG